MDSFDGFAWSPQSLHKYTYNLNDPINRIDPSGNVSLAQVGVSAQVVGTLLSTASALNTAYQDLQAGASLGQVSANLAIDAALGAGVSFLAGGALRFAPSILRIRPRGLNVPVTGRAKNSIWNIRGITPRGEAVENRLLGGRRDLPWNTSVRLIIE